MKKKLYKHNSLNLSFLIICDIHYINELEKKRLKTIQNTESFDACLLLGDIPTDVVEIVSKNITKPIFAVAGNHDTLEIYNYPNIVYLNGKMSTVNGYTIAGIDGSHRYKDSFYLVMQTQSESVNTVKKLHRADILISHDSAYKVFGKEKNKCGLKGISRYIKNKKPIFHIHGHHHQRLQYRFHRTNCICSYRAQVSDLNGETKVIF